MNLQFVSYTQNFVTIKSLGFGLFPIYFSGFRLEDPACPYALAHSLFGLVFALFLELLLDGNIKQVLVVRIWIRSVCGCSWGHLWK